MDFIKNKKVIIIFWGLIFIVLGIIYELINKNKEYDYNIFEDEIDNNTIIQNIDDKNEIIIHISGEVMNEGIIKLKEGDRISNAIEKAGGITENADMSKINLAYKVKDGQKIYIPSIYDEEIKEYITEKAGESILENSEKTNKVNINTATRRRIRNIIGNWNVYSNENHKI